MVRSTPQVLSCVPVAMQCRNRPPWGEPLGTMPPAPQALGVFSWHSRVGAAICGSLTSWHLSGAEARLPGAREPEPRAPRPSCLWSPHPCQALPVAPWLWQELPVGHRLQHSSVHPPCVGEGLGLPVPHTLPHRRSAWAHWLTPTIPTLGRLRQESSRPVWTGETLSQKRNKPHRKQRSPLRLGHVTARGPKIHSTGSPPPSLSHLLPADPLEVHDCG